MTVTIYEDDNVLSLSAKEDTSSAKTPVPIRVKFAKRNI
jgi:hypothetical protein